ncbi:MAG: hypothetical protein M1833_004150 [Piccolia ochrophora]|nr:MAG: hypothetical protein M1833_004150 [Piccolia ochrophora]
MDFLLPWRRKGRDIRTCWGYTFDFTSKHLEPEELHSLKYTCDELADKCLSRLNELAPPSSPSLPKRSSQVNGQSKDAVPEKSVMRRDLYALLRDHATEDPILERMWTEVNAVPKFVDWDQIARGQEVFYRYGGAALTGLAYQSLLGGMARVPDLPSGASRVVETLARTGGFSPKVARGRLYETTQHILQCTRSIESIQPGGEGHISSIRVRFLHSAVRQRILKLASQRPEYYSVEKWGIPINDLDSIGTISTFSATLIWISFPRQGIWLRKQEIEDYLALWRLIAYYLGTPTEHFATPGSAKAIMESLLISEINPTDTSKILANNIITALAAQPPGYASRDFLTAGARWLNGDELADRLGLGRPSLWYKALVLGQIIFFMSLCYSHRSIPALDRRKIATLRRVFYTIIVNKKHGLAEETKFEFKYVPDFHITSTESAAPEESGIKTSGVERRSLKVLMYAVFGLVVTLSTVFKALVVLGPWLSRRGSRVPGLLIQAHELVGKH